MSQTPEVHAKMSRHLHVGLLLDHRNEQSQPDDKLGKHDDNTLAAVRPSQPSPDSLRTDAVSRQSHEDIVTFHAIIFESQTL